MVVIAHLFKMFRVEHILGIIKVPLIFFLKPCSLLKYVRNKYNSKVITSYPFCCIIQQVWYWRAIIIFIILTSFAEVAAAAVIIRLVKRKKCAKAGPAHGACALYHTYFIFVASIIRIPVNN